MHLDGYRGKVTSTSIMTNQALASSSNANPLNGDAKEVLDSLDILLRFVGQVLKPLHASGRSIPSGQRCSSLRKKKRK
jgi:hypothetical protein